MAMIHRRAPQVQGVDDVEWRGVACPTFPIQGVLKDVYTMLSPILPRQYVSTIWHNYIPPRAQLSLWFVMLGRLKTGSALLDKGIIQAPQGLCPMCGAQVETQTHIIFTCYFSWCVWMQVLEWCNIQGVLHRDCGSFVDQWKGLLLGRKWRRVRLLLIGCVVWSIWYERNEIKFQGKSPNLHQMVASLKCRVGGWVKEYMGVSCFSPRIPLLENF